MASEAIIFFSPHLLLLPKSRFDDMVQISSESLSGASEEVMIS
jgi:hypothetical protein